jgi:hypothetical protein
VEVVWRLTTSPRRLAESQVSPNEMPVVHLYELDGPTRSYAPAGILRGSLRVAVPFGITLDPDKLASPRRH